MISRRSLFGVGAGAVAASVVTVPSGLRAEQYFTSLEVDISFELQAEADRIMTTRLDRMVRVLNDAGID